MAGADWALKPLRTDSVSRGSSISLFTRETIFLSISIRLFFFMKRPLFERWANQLVTFSSSAGSESRLVSSVEIGLKGARNLGFLEDRHRQNL